MTLITRQFAIVYTVSPHLSLLMGYLPREFSTLDEALLFVTEKFDQDDDRWANLVIRREEREVKQAS